MKRIKLSRFCAIMVCMSTICLGSCEKENHDCVWCYPDTGSDFWDIWNREMLCNPDPLALQRSIASKEAEGWNCNEP